MSALRAGGIAAAGCLAGLLLVAVSGVPASAHDSLVSSDPRAGDTVTSAVSEVRLTFSENVLDLGAGASAVIRVRDEDGRYYGDGCLALSNETMTAQVQLGGTGTYEVEWRAVSVDGHPISDLYSFDYAPPSGTPQADGLAEPPACGDATIAPANDESEGSGDDTAGLVVGLSIGAGLMVAGSVGVVLAGRIRARARKQPTLTR